MAFIEKKEKKKQKNILGHYSIVSIPSGQDDIDTETS